VKAMLQKHKFIVFAGLTTSAIVGVFIFVLFLSLNKPQFTGNNTNTSSNNQTENTKLNSSDANQESSHFNILSILNKFISN